MVDTLKPETLPNMTVETTQEALNLADLAGKRVVIYFYPKDNTPGCTIESKAFRDHHPAFEGANTVVLGVSKDTLEKHHRFCDKYDFPFPLISDTEGKLCDYFGVLREKSLFGKKFVGIERSTFLFNEKGQLAKAWRKVSVKGHVKEVLDFVLNLGPQT